MDKYTKKQNVYISEEENTLIWDDIQNSFKKTFGSEIYNSWLQKITLIKEYNDYLILGVPTRFFRDWIVSRYLDKILEQVKSFKLSLTRIEFKIVEELSRRPGQIKPRDLLMEVAYREDTEVEDRTIDSHIKRIRRKFREIDKKFSAIETRYGSGYRWNVK